MSAPDVALRAATPEDGPAVAAIYAPVVRDTAISFESEPPDGDEFARRIEARLPTHPWLVAERAGRVLGYAYATRFRDRDAYRWSAETSLYVATEAHRTGAGRALYRALLACLERQGFHLAVAGSTLPNPPSAAFHEALGFERVGAFSEVGFKRGAWWDVGFWQLRLGEGAPTGPPRGFAEALAAGAFDDLLRRAPGSPASP